MKDPNVEKYVDTLRGRDVAVFFIRPSPMLAMWGLRYFQINTPSMQERIRLVDAVLGLMVRKESEDD